MNNLQIEKLVPGGQALATLPDGKKIFLWNALPGEIVTDFEITKNKSHYAEGVATQLDCLSTQRIAPRDVCYLSTSPWQIMDYAYELEQKTALLVEGFSQQKIELSEFDLTVQTDGNAWQYRNKMEYALYYSHDDAQIHLAFHGRGSHRKIPIETSSLERPEILTRAQALVSELNQRGADARAYQSLLLRSDQNGNASGGFYLNHQPHPEFELLKDTLLGYEYSYSPNGFFQINLPVYELALKEISRWIKTDQVLDLYAGVGSIGLTVAREHQLTLVECNDAAYQEMVRNCTGIHNATPILAKSEDVLEYLQPEQTVILDPPRAGCESKLINRLLEVQPPTIIYLSCNPATQARDVAALLSEYQIASVTPFNFFPRTPHLENLVVLTKE